MLRYSFNPIKIACAVIIADDRLHSLGKSGERSGKELKHTLHDCQGTYVQISSVYLQSPVEHNTDQAFRGSHDKGGNTQGTNLPHNAEGGTHMAQRQAEGGFRAHKEFYVPGRAYRLGKHSCYGRALHSPAKYKNKQRIQGYIYHRSYHDGYHGDPGAALGNNKGIQPEGQLHKQGSQQIYVHVIHGIADGGIRCAEHI